jgi:hypothetical protein
MKMTGSPPTASTWVEKQDYRQRVLDGKHPALLKPASYAHQREVRALWTPRSQPIEPIVLTVPAVIPICVIHYEK